MKSLKTKEYLEVEQLYEKLKHSNGIDIYKNYEGNQNFNSGYIETLEMILNSLNIYEKRITIDILVQYRLYLEDRHNRDMDIYSKDITLGWIKGSIYAIDWFFNANVNNVLQI